MLIYYETVGPVENFTLRSGRSKVQSNQTTRQSILSERVMRRRYWLAKVASEIWQVWRSNFLKTQTSVVMC